MRARTKIAAITLAAVTAFGSGLATAADPEAATPEEVVSKVWGRVALLE
jgi:hypothetical protein